MEPAELEGVDVPPVKDFLKSPQKSGRELVAEEVYNETYAWLKARGCEKLVTVQMVEQYAMSVSRWPFSYGVAGYPEKHDESPNLDMDIAYLKQKIDNGAEYVVTQMFFDNSKYYDFVDRCRKAGINVPIIPGLRPITTIGQLNILPKVFHVDMPMQLVSELMKCKDDNDAKEVGVEWCKAQCLDLMAHGVPSIHFYSLNSTRSVERVAASIY